MSTGTGIEWTDATWNPTSGCNPVSPGCAHCYAKKMSKRLQAMARADEKAGRNPGKKHFYLHVIDEEGEWNGQVNTIEAALTIPLHWKSPRKIFVDSMSDLFWGTPFDLDYARRHGVKDPKPVPFDFIDKVFAVMALCPQHTFQILTKRPERMAAYMQTFYPEGGRLEAMLGQMQTSGESPFDGATIDDERRLSEIDVLPNVHLGTSCENQKAADERITHLLKCPAASLFISAEPLLGPIDFTVFPREPSHFDKSLAGQERVKSYWFDALSGQRGVLMHDGQCLESDVATDPHSRISWIIAGGESGPGSRPCNIEWIRSIVRQCKDAGVPCFVKQVGSHPTASYYDRDLRNWYEQQGWEWPDPIDWNIDRDGQPPLDSRVEIKGKDKKGGDIREFPAYLRVREFPVSVAAP